MGSLLCRSCMTWPVEPWNPVSQHWTRKHCGSYTLGLPRATQEHGCGPVVRLEGKIPVPQCVTTSLPLHSSNAQERETQKCPLGDTILPLPHYYTRGSRKGGEDWQHGTYSEQAQTAHQACLTIHQGQRHRVCVKVGDSGRVDLRHCPGGWPLEVVYSL